MLKFLQSTSIVAILTLLATSPTLGTAQVANPDDPPVEGSMTEEAPAAGNSENEGTATQQVPTADDPTPGDVTSDPAAANDVVVEEPVKPVEGHIVLQSENTILAKDLLGSTVYTTAGDETVGDIANLIISLDGTVEGVVIGVGGFLGIGEKPVAVEMSSLQISRDEADNARLVTGATKADLEAAEEFVTAKEQEDAAAAEQIRQDGVAPSPGVQIDGTAPEE